MAGVAGDEHAGPALRDFFFGQVVELVAEALPDLVDRPPGNFFHFEGKGTQDSLRGRDQAVNRDVPAGNPLVFAELVEFDVDANQIPAFTRDQQYGALVRGLYQ